MSEYSMTKPCPQCPFRSDVKPYLNKDRVREIERSLSRGEFPCHKTTTHDDEGQAIPSAEDVHCAGALILMEKTGRPSQMMRIAERLGMYDRSKLDMTAPVFDSFNDMIAAQGGDGENGECDDCGATLDEYGNCDCETY